MFCNESTFFHISSKLPPKSYDSMSISGTIGSGTVAVFLSQELEVNNIMINDKRVSFSKFLTIIGICFFKITI